jgi:hypothetical protein
MANIVATSVLRIKFTSHPCQIKSDDNQASFAYLMHGDQSQFHGRRCTIRPNGLMLHQGITHYKHPSSLIQVNNSSGRLN